MNAGRFGSGEVEGRRLCHRVAEGHYWADRGAEVPH